MNSTRIQNASNHIQREKGKQAHIEQTITNLRLLIRGKKKDLRQHEQAREIMKEVGLKTQQQLQFHISNITTLALEAVFEDNPYTLLAEFVERRNKTECDLLFERDGEKIKPMEASGGGAVDVAAFALRIASWSMQQPRSRNVIILDEPMRFLSADRQEQASKMIKEISQKLGIQFIIITHEQELTIYADKIFKTSIKNGITKIQ